MDLQTLWKIEYGMFIVSSHLDVKLNGQIANTVFQITAEPPTIAASLNKLNLTHDFVEKSRVFSVSILAADAPMQLIGRFGFKSGREIDKFTETKHRIGMTGAPIVLEHAIGFIECEVINELDCGTHTLFLGKVVDCDIIDPQKSPLTYSDYHIVKHGKTPKTATTYIAQAASSKDAQKEDSNMEKFVCTVCGYIYDPAEGDPDNGIKPGTSFSELPEDWVCPICGVGKEEFEPEE